MRSSWAQTKLTRTAASWYSSKLGTVVTVGGVDIEFFKKLVFRDVYIQDLHRDTLLYLKELKLDVTSISFKKHELYASELIMENVRAKLARYKGENRFNFQFLIDAFSVKDTVKTRDSPWEIQCADVALRSVDFTYKNLEDAGKSAGINFSDLAIKNLNGNLRKIHFEKKELTVTVSNLSAREKSGFVLTTLNTKASLSSVRLLLEKLEIVTPLSHISTDLTMSYTCYGDFSDFLNQVNLKAKFDTCRVEFSDLAYFAPALKGIHHTVIFSGNVNGKISAINGRQMKIRLGKSTFFDGDIKLDGLPDIDETVMYLKVNKVITNRNDLQEFPIPPFTDGKTLEIPVNMTSLGAISFHGNMAGFLDDFVAYGTFYSALGSVSTDLSVNEDFKTGKLYYDGKLNSEGFDIGQFLNIKQVGILALDAAIKGSGVESDKVDAKLDGTIKRIDAMGYSYKDVLVSARVSKKIFDGSLFINDDNLKLNFDGNINFSNVVPLLNFGADIRYANLTALHLITNGKPTSFSSVLAIKMKGNTIDNITGVMDVNHTQVSVDKDVFNFHSFRLLATNDSKIKQLNIESDFFTGDIKGKFTLKELGVSVENLLSTVMPAYFSSIHLKVPVEENFELKAKLNKPRDFMKLFFPKYEIADGTLINGSYSSSMEQLGFTISSSRISVFGKQINNLDVNSQLRNGKLDVHLKSSQIAVSDSAFFKNFDLDISTKNDSSALQAKWGNHSHPENSGMVKAKLIFKTGPEIRFSFLPSEVVIADSVWNVNSTNLISIDPSCVYIHNMEFANGLQHITINGSSSNYSNDSMFIAFSQFNLANLNKMTGAGLKLKGIVNGKTVICGIYSSPVILSNNNFTDLQINTERIGNGYVKTIWDTDKDALGLNGLFSKELLPNIVFSGFYYPKKGNSIDLNLTLNTLSLDLLKPYVKEYCRDLSGDFSGMISIKGPISKPDLNGKLRIDAKKITVNYLGTSYSFKQDLIIEPNSFGFQNLIVYDQVYEQNRKNNTLSDKDKKSGSGTAIVNGKLYHDNFKNFQLDFDIAPTKFMALNTNENDNSLYYGKAYVTGPHVNISGFLNNIIHIVADVKTDKVTFSNRSELTKLYIPLTSTTDISSTNYITFISKDTIHKINKYKVDLSGLQLDFDLDMTTDAEIQLIFDQKVGDVIKAQGNGAVKLEISTLGKFNMFGNYTVENGDYLFTLQNIINKKFNLEKGGTIKWAGDPYDASIDLSAIYKVRTSLTPLFDTSAIYKHQYPVNCKMLLANKLMSPDITFDIDLPTADEGTRRDVRSIVNSDLEMNRQVFSLMVLGSFVTPQNLAGFATNETSSAGLNASSELLSNQLSNMLSKISKDFDLGVKYQAGDKLTNEEMQVALSTQLFNNRLAIDGNFGVSSSVTQNTNTLVGDVNMEYKLTDDGKVRIKAFNRTNDNAIINLSSPYTQGVGIFYREEFNTISDLWKRYILKTEKKVGDR